MTSREISWDVDAAPILIEHPRNRQLD